MPSIDYQSFSLISLLTPRRDQIHAMEEEEEEPTHNQIPTTDQDLNSFQHQIFLHFTSLSSSPSTELLSLPWLLKLLNSFLLSQSQFRILLFNHRTILSRTPLHRLLTDFYDRSLKSLDLLNAIRDGVDQLKLWLKHIEIVLLALNPKSHFPIGEGQIRRAHKSLTDLTLSMLGDPAIARRNQSFGRSNHSSRRHLRSLSWSVSRSWSAARQLQAIGSGIAAPRGNEIAATGGLANSVFTMNTVLHFVMWSMVAAIPCQDRGLQAHFSIPRSFAWGGSVTAMHDRIMEESKRRERRNAAGLLKEIHGIEICARRLLEITGCVVFPMGAEKEGELRKEVEELGEIFDSMKEGLEIFEKQVRDVFHRIVRSRMEDLDLLSNSSI